MSTLKWACAAATVLTVASAATFARHVSKPKLANAAPPGAPAPPATISVHADGRVTVLPGSQATLSAELMARVITVNVVEGQQVKKGDVLVELDKREYLAALGEALGSGAEARARLKGRRDDLKRSKALVQSGALPDIETTRMKEETNAAQGRLYASGAAAARARALLAKTRIVAPIDGVIVSRLVSAAETVAPGMPLVVVADLSKRRVEAEVDEYDVGRVELGTKVEVRADGFPGAVFDGAVEEIPDVVGPRKLRPQDPARPTDSSVLLVKVSIPPDSPLKLGQRVSAVFLSGPATAQLH